MTSDYKKKNTDLVSYIPKTYRSVANTSLLRNLHNKFLTKEETTPMLGYIGDKILNDTSPYVSSANLDREINSLIPTVYTKLGSEEYIFTFSDVLQKLNLLGIDVNDFPTWGKATSFNFVPPIDLDKFSNYSRYRWYGHLLGISLPYNQKMDPEYYVISKTGTSDWATTNYWIHEDDANLFFADYGWTFTIDSTIQAIRPIIEYDAGLEPEMLLHITNGRPSSSGKLVDQTAAGYKTEFNQTPLFNLYLYNGIHSGFVSPIFYYAEGNEYPVDSAMKTRIKTDVYGDYTFEQGLISKDGKRTLFYTNANTIKSIWTKGPVESPVYYVKNSVGDLVESTPLDDVDGGGTWKFPNQMFYNVAHENRKQIGYGDLLGHFTNIILSQDGFEGNPYGSNNFRDLPTYDFGLGGKIKDYDTNFSLFLGLINQLDCSVPSIIEFGKLQYAQMLGSITEFVTQNLADVLTDGLIDIPKMVSSNTLDTNLIPLFDSFLTFVTTRNDSSVFSDTTSSIPGWPVTLPYLGLAPLSVPTVYFETAIGSLVLVHHDGHLSIVSTSNTELDKKLAGISYLRSDGNTVSGVIGSAPVRPYKNQFWFDIASNTLKVFNISSDSPEIPVRNNGGYFYDRTNGMLFQYDELSNSYVVESDTSKPWTVVSSASVINQMMMMVEQKLYDGCPDQLVKLDQDDILLSNTDKTDAYLALEFAIFAAKHGLDISGGDYTPSDAFTWNYSSVTIPGTFKPSSDWFMWDYSSVDVPELLRPARWFMIYKSYFGTIRPNLMPWFLQGYSNKPDWWDGLYADVSGTRIWTTQMWIDIKNDSTPGYPAPTGAWTKKLCVDILTDNLLPPYVSPTNANSGEALLNVIPTGITNGYEFGDFGPTEMEWRISVDCNYDKLKVCFKLDPINFINATWGYDNISIDGYEIDTHEHRKLSHHDFILHGETPTQKFTGCDVIDISQASNDAEDTLWTLTCLGTSTGSIFAVTGNVSGVISRSCVTGTEFISSLIRFTVLELGSDYNVGDRILISLPSKAVSYVPSVYAKFLGLNQWFVNLNRYNSVDMSIALANNILRDWDSKLGHRMSGLVNTELFNVKSDKFALHGSDYEIIIKENKNISSYWLNALRIQLLHIGDSEYVNGKLVPKNKGADWKFRIETFNIHNPTIQYYEYDANGKYQTYFAFEKENSKDTWVHLKDRANLVSRSSPFVVTGIENVANVIFGYVDKLDEDGWRFNQSDDPEIDVATGRTINWQMNVERFINQQYLGVKAGSGIILNPFASAVWFATPHGFVASLRNPTTSDITSAQSIFDSFGNTISNKDIQIFRNDNITEIRSAVVIGGIHLLLDEYEHIALFENYTSDQSRNKLVYDPFLGARVNRLYISTERQPSFNGRLSFGGHYIKDHKVNRNIEASITDMLNYYDADKMIDNSATSKAARSLLGYGSKQYMTDIELSDKSQFGFWRGLISNKGSNLSIDAFVNSARFESAKIDEFWAYKLAEFGDARQLSFPEIKLSSMDAQHNYTKIQFVADDVVGSPGFINVHPSDESRWVSQEDQESDLFFNAEMIGEVYFEDVQPNIILDLAQNGKLIIADYVEVYEHVGDISPELIRTYDFELVNSTTIKFTSDTSITRKFVVKCFGPSQPKFNPAKLIDYKNKVVISDLALWDPARGAHTSEALEIVDMITPNDPSKYSYSVRTVNNINYDPYRQWDNKDVGRVWWNTQKLDYIPYSDVKIFPSLDVRLSYWGALSDWSSIELYEWTESTAHPSAYAALVATQEGNSSIAIDTRASGNVAMSELYSRNRSWRQRPIAWGYTDAPGSVTPSLESVGEYSVSFRADSAGNTVAILSSNDWVTSFSDIAVGMKLSGGLFHYNPTDVSDEDNFKLSKPYGEAVVTGLNQAIVIGSSTAIDSAVFSPIAYTFDDAPV